MSSNNANSCPVDSQCGGDNLSCVSFSSQDELSCPLQGEQPQLYVGKVASGNKMITQVSLRPTHSIPNYGTENRSLAYKFVAHGLLCGKPFTLEICHKNIVECFQTYVKFNVPPTFLIVVIDLLSGYRTKMIPEAFCYYAVGGKLQKPFVLL